MTFWCTSHCSAPSLESSAEDIPCPIIQIINEDEKHDWTPYSSLQHAASYWPPARLCVADHHTLGSVIQPVSRHYGVTFTCPLLNPVPYAPSSLGHPQADLHALHWSLT